MKGSTNVPSCYLILKKDNKVLFLLRSETGYKDGSYGLPGGHVESMENYTNATVREATEEIGVSIDPKKLKHVHTLHRNHGDHVRVDVFFEVDKWEGEPINNEPNKHSHIAWFELNNLPKNVTDYVLVVFERIQKGQTYSEYGWDE